MVTPNDQQSPRRMAQACANVCAEPWLRHRASLRITIIITGIPS